MLSHVMDAVLLVDYSYVLLKTLHMFQRGANHEFQMCISERVQQ